ncbi:MAG: glycerol kinase GlpK [Anaerolineae bacterium]|nr:glycerol kinase GlpK [Anaerolineae bacterium]
MAKTYIMGIDQGTTGTKVVIFDHDSNIVGSAYSEFPQYFPKPGWVEHDATEIFDVTLKVAGEALKDAGVSAKSLAGIGITNQRETTTFWDKETGQPQGRSIVWQDRRTLEICEQLIAKDHAGIEARTGMVIVPNDAATKIRWLLDNDEAVREGVEKGRLIYGTVDSWLIWKLSGGAAHVSDLSNTSVTLLLNALELDYDEWILNELAIPRHILPELKSSSEIYAYTDPDIFFGARVPIAGIAGDQQAAAFGQACVKPGMAKNTYGTGCFMVMNTGNKYVPASRGMFSPVLWGSKENPTYGIEAMANVCGAVVQWLRDGLGIISESAEVGELAGAVEDTQGVYFVPAFAGLGAPYLDSYARGSMFGITRGTTKHHIARAALESMAYQTRDFLETMEDMSGVKLAALRVDGGAVKNDFVCQFQADILGIPVDRPVITETTVLGAAYLAGVGVGYWESMDEMAAHWQLDRRFEPQMSADRREELYAGWKKACKRAAGWLKE